VVYTPRITAEPVYLQALGQAFYNFTYLEWVVVWTIVKLGSDGFDSVPKGKTALNIASALAKAIDNTSPPLPKELRRQLVKFEEKYRAAIKVRNKLLHAHPFTGSDGKPQLGGGGHEWPLHRVYEVAQQFEEAAITGNDIFHGKVAKVRP
jgi:hypothetical protein